MNELIFTASEKYPATISLTYAVIVKKVKAYTCLNGLAEKTHPKNPSMNQQHFPQLCA